MATPQNTSEKQANGYGSCGEPSRNQRDALACLGAELLRRAEESQPVLEGAWNELMASWGIQGEAVGIERLRNMIQTECGANPGDNAFSRELIELREERRS